MSIDDGANGSLEFSEISESFLKTVDENLSSARHIIRNHSLTFSALGKKIADKRYKYSYDYENFLKKWMPVGVKEKGYHSSVTPLLQVSLQQDLFRQDKMNHKAVLEWLSKLQESFLGDERPLEDRVNFLHLAETSYLKGWSGANEVLADQIFNQSNLPEMNTALNESLRKVFIKVLADKDIKLWNGITRSLQLRARGQSKPDSHLTTCWVNNAFVLDIDDMSPEASEFRLKAMRKFIFDAVRGGVINFQDLNTQIVQNIMNMVCKDDADRGIDYAHALRAAKETSVKLGDSLSQKNSVSGRIDPDSNRL